jgi:hypothetical protein
LKVERNEIEESNQARSQYGAVLQESSRNEWVVGKSRLVESEDHQEDGSDDKHGDDLVAAPWYFAAVSQSKRQKELQTLSISARRKGEGGTVKYSRMSIQQ